MTQFIQSRHNKRLALIVDQPESPTGLAFIAHGLGGYKEQKDIALFAEELVGHGHIAVRFDAGNTFGESEGSYEEATVTSYKEDLEDVIAWAATQPWHRETFALAGSSLGGMTTLLFAEEHPEKVSALIEFAPVISGNLSYEYSMQMRPEQSKAWQESGWKEEPSISKPGLIKRLPWSHMEDRMQYDVLPAAHKLTMPKLILVGSEDASCPEEHQRLLLAALPNAAKTLEVIDGMPHTPREDVYLEKIRAIVSDWLDSIKE